MKSVFLDHQESISEQKRRRAVWGGEGWATAAALLFILLCLLFFAQAGSAFAATNNDGAGKGVFVGRVVDTATDKPIVGAIVALRDKKGKTLVWSTTDAEGRYVLTADTMDSLRLKPTRRKGFLEKTANAVGSIAAAPVRFVGNAFKMGPLEAGKMLVTTVVGGPMGAIAGRVGGAVMGRLGSSALKSVVSPGSKTDRRSTVMPGQIGVLVSAKGYKELSGTASTYWLDAPATGHEADCGTTAHLQTVALAPSETDTVSVVREEAVFLEDLQIEQTLVPAGGKVGVSVRLTDPEKRTLPVRVFAREAKQGTITELRYQPDGRYCGEISIPKETPSGELAIVIAALRAEPLIGENRSDDAAKTLAAQREEMRPDKPWNSDPCIFAATNRLEMSLTILGAQERTKSPQGIADSGGQPTAGEKIVRNP